MQTIHVCGPTLDRNGQKLKLLYDGIGNYELLKLKTIWSLNVFKIFEMIVIVSSPSPLPPPHFVSGGAGM